MIPNIFSLLGESIVGKHIAKGIIFSNSPKKFHPNGSRIQVKEKSNRFADSYFSGSHANAAAALLKNVTLTEEQAEELKSILEACRFSETGREKEGQGK